MLCAYVATSLQSIAAMPSPLAGRRILVTRTRSQASALADALLDQAAIPIVIPAIEIASPDSFTALDEVLVSLHEFDWVIFTSANAVDAVVSRARHLRLDLQPRRLAAIGPATRAALAAAAIAPLFPPVLLPPVAVAESLLDQLLPALTARSPHFVPVKICLIRAQMAREILPEGLRAAGAFVTIAPAYRTVVPVASVDTLRQSFSYPATFADAVTFTSSSTALHLPPLLSAAGLSLPAATRRVSIGPATSATLCELGMPAHTEAATPTISALIDALIQAFSAPVQED